MDSKEIKELQETTSRAVNSAFDLVGAVCEIMDKIGSDGKRPRNEGSEDKHEVQA